MKIKELYIKNFRSIQEQSISNIEEALILVGKNNSGKSAVLTAIRAFWGDYSIEPKDYYKNSDEIIIKITFGISDDYLKSLLHNEKIGYLKWPANTTDFNLSKANTFWAEKDFSDFKDNRNIVLDDCEINERYMDIWLNCAKHKLSIVSQRVTVKCCISKDKQGKSQYYINKELCKDFIYLLPYLAFIDDSRNFSDEETGKAKTLTSNIIKIIQSEIVQTSRQIKCENCSYTDCDERCFNELVEKSVEDLTSEDLEKLINIQLRRKSGKITSSVSDYFQKNYRNNYKVSLKVTSNTEKAISVATKIYDPVLDREIELSNVGAGIRSIYLLSLLQSFQGMKSSNAIFLIEEPELYLHPELQRKMAKTLSKISSTSQVIFTTHSPVMLNEFRVSEIRKASLNIESYYSTFLETSISDVLSEIGYATQDILQTDFVLFVEGNTDKTILENLLKKYYNIDLQKISIIDTKSCNNISFYATLRFLEKTTLNSNFAIIRDLDTSTKGAQLEKLRNQMSTNGIQFNFEDISRNIMITKYSSIEGYLFSPELLCSEGIYQSETELYEYLKEGLLKYKQNQIKYFSKHNSDDPERIKAFESEYDEKIADIENNIEWMKINIRGHNYFDFTRSTNIDFQTYIDKLKKNVFDDIFNFLNNIDFFNSRYICDNQ